MKVVDLHKPEEKVQYTEGTEWDRVTQDYIRQYKGILTEEQCRTIIAAADYGQWEEVKRDDTRVCDIALIESPALDNILFDAFGRMLKHYAKDYWRAASMNTDTGYSLLRYSISDHCPIHHEPAGCGIRAMIDLCESDGGELQFFGKEKADSSVGTGIIFPASFMFPYEVLPVIEGYRYYVTTTFK
jgi:hypothetical protein